MPDVVATSSESNPAAIGIISVGVRASKAGSSLGPSAPSSTAFRLAGRHSDSGIAAGGPGATVGEAGAIEQWQIVAS